MQGGMVRMCADQKIASDIILFVAINVMNNEVARISFSKLWKRSAKCFFCHHDVLIFSPLRRTNDHIAMR